MIQELNWTQIIWKPMILKMFLMNVIICNFVPLAIGPYYMNNKLVRESWTAQNRKFNTYRNQSALKKKTEKKHAHHKKSKYFMHSLYI